MEDWMGMSECRENKMNFSWKMNSEFLWKMNSEFSWKMNSEFLSKMNSEFFTKNEFWIFTKNELDLHQRLTALLIGGISDLNAPVEPNVRNSHAVLGECARLIGANGGGGPERFHRLQVLHQAILLRHPLRCQRQTYLECKGRATLSVNSLPHEAT